VSHIVWQLRTIRRLVSQSVFQSLVAALVLTKLDGNATLDGIPSFQPDRLQAVMNAAARLVSATSPLAVSSCAAAHIFQACRPWSWTGLPGRRPSACRQDSRLTTPAVIVDVGIGRTVYTTVHCRRPSVSRRRGTNVEQFSS